MTSLGDVLTVTRRARGMTQEELAELTGVTQAALSRYENGLREPDDGVIEQLASALGVTKRFFTHAGKFAGAMAVDAHMRRRQTAKPSIWKKLEAQLNVYRMHASMIFEEVQIRSDQRIPTFDPLDTSPDDAARLVRMQWRLPVGPVKALTQWLESAGCLVIEEDFGTDRVDGLSQWVGGHPVIFINVAAPTDRKRWTLAHELGHLVLHSEEVVAELEEQADRFAAEFLMPIEVIRPQLRQINLGKLIDLKRQWGVSMAALIEQAYRHGLLNAERRQNLYKMLGAKQWRTREPISDELAPETPRLPIRIGEALMKRGLSPDEVAHLAGFAEARQNFLVPTQGRRLRAVSS